MKCVEYRVNVILPSHSSHVKPHCSGDIIDNNDGYAIIVGGNLDFRVRPRGLSKLTYAGVYVLWWGA